VDRPLTFGTFIAPFHPVGQNPTLAIERDLELVVRLDQLGFHEAWIGEHHSAGYEIIASPEVAIAVLSQRTKNIRLGTGVSSLPYHQPLILADRMVLLDHITRGRVMFGVGPGALPSDAFMMGIDPAVQRDRMEESLEAILALLDGSELVSRQAEWFTLRNARLQLRPYTHPRFEVAVAAQVSPPARAPLDASGCRCSPSGPRRPEASTSSVRTGRPWRSERPNSAPPWTAPNGAWWAPCTSPRPKSRPQGCGLRFGPVGRLLRTRRRPAPGPGTLDPDKLVDALMETGFAVVGTPEMAVAQIKRLIEQSGGFGTFLLMAHEWADRAATLHSYELFAREVMPHFQGSLPSLVGSRDWAAENRPEFIGAVGGAIMQAITDHAAEREAKKDKAGESARP
jgi:limonene 1,2-monooxygenase